MNEAPNPAPPVSQAQPLPAARPRRSPFVVLFLLSAMGNLAFCTLSGLVLLLAGAFGHHSDEELPLDETFHSGSTGAGDKVAVVRIEGVILEGFLDYPRRQIKQAANDPDVKAVVIRINSPGGSITASDELHQRISELVQGTAERDAKPTIVSMGAMAASGGYYVAMPCKTLYAERTTLTGSIGVFASFPNIKELSDWLGIKMETVKRGAVKDSGSPFKDMTPQDRQLWQEMVDHAYEQFQTVVEQGRPELKGKLQEEVVRKMIPVRDPKTEEERKEPFVRTRADGGVFTADQAKQFGLIDKIGFLDEAVKDAATAAGLGTDYRAVVYARRRSLPELLLGVQAPRQGGQLDPAKLATAATPRLWFLAPQSELAGLLTAAGQ